jgi:putative addiction module component (TIGR02574 family)
VDEKIGYLQSLWDRIAATPAKVPVPAWHAEILHERTRKLEANPDAGRSWKDVREDIERRLRNESAR